MPDETRNMLRYRILRYTPNLVRDEWVNIGVLLEEGPEEAGRQRWTIVAEAGHPSDRGRVRNGAGAKIASGRRRGAAAGTARGIRRTFARGRVRSGSLRGETRQHAFKRAAIQPAARLAGRKFRRRAGAAFSGARGGSASGARNRARTCGIGCVRAWRTYSSGGASWENSSTACRWRNSRTRATL